MLQLALDLDFSNYSNVVQLRKKNTQPPTPEVKKTETRAAKTTPTPTTTPTTAKTTAPEISKPIQWYRKFFWRREVPIAKIREWGGGDCRRKATYIKAFAYYTEHYTQKDSSIENVSTPNDRAKFLADILQREHSVSSQVVFDRFVEIRDMCGVKLDLIYAFSDGECAFFQGLRRTNIQKINTIYGLDILGIIDEVEAKLQSQKLSRSPLPKPKSKSKSKPLSRSPLPKPESSCNDNLANNLATPNERAKILADILSQHEIKTEIVFDRFVRIQDSDGKKLGSVFTGDLGVFVGLTPKNAAKINKIYGLDVLAIINEVEASLTPQSFKSSLPKLKSKSKSPSKSKILSLSRSPLPQPESPCNDNLADNLATPNERAKILADTLKAEVCYSQVVEPKSTSANVVSRNQVVSINQTDGKIIESPLSRSELKPEPQSKTLSLADWLNTIIENTIESINIEVKKEEKKADEGDIVEITSYWAGEKRGLKTTVTGRNRNFITYELEGKEYFEQDGGYQILERGVCW